MIAWWSEAIKSQIKIKKLERLSYQQNIRKVWIIQDRKKVKELVAISKKQKWKKFYDKMERNSKSNPKLFYKTLKSLRKDKYQEINRIKNKHWEIIMKDEKMETIFPRITRRNNRHWTKIKMIKNMGPAAMKILLKIY